MSNIESIYTITITAGDYEDQRTDLIFTGVDFAAAEAMFVETIEQVKKALMDVALHGMDSLLVSEDISNIVRHRDWSDYILFTLAAMPVGVLNTRGPRFVRYENVAIQDDLFDHDMDDAVVVDKYEELAEPFEKHFGV